jgi:hypothetical protein
VITVDVYDNGDNEQGDTVTEKVTWIKETENKRYLLTENLSWIRKIDDFDIWK